MKKTILLLLFLLFLPLPLIFGQTTDENSFWSKWGIGGGYNFLHRSELPFNERTFEVSVRYLYTDKHSFYLAVPFYFENNKDKQDEFKLGMFEDPWLHRIWGIGIGYNYTIFEWNGISGFGGVGFDFRRDNHQSIHYYSLDDDFGKSYETYSISSMSFTGYGLSPQAGLRYRLNHLGCELKYEFSVFRIRMTPQLQHEDGQYAYDKDQTANSREHYFRCLQDLSLSLFYYF